MLKRIPESLWIFFVWLLLTSVSIIVRPLFPVDETRYVSVAWEMWLNHDYWVPHLNGETYSHKPPLLFWLINLVWAVVGVNETAIRFIGPLFSLAGLYLTGQIARLLWPQRPQAMFQVQWVLLGMFLWMLYGSLTMFDMMLACFALLGIYSVLKLARCGLNWRRWLLLSLAIGGGILSKGPVILLHVLPLALLAPWWLERPKNFSWRQWYGGVFVAVLIGAAIALAWAIPAGFKGGEAYRQAIFWGQTSGRIVKSFAHQLPWWWYFKWLPLLLLPWLLWRPFWQGLRAIQIGDTSIRFILAWIVPVIIAFSLISGKRLHYWLPLVPGFALLISAALAHALAHREGGRPWGIALLYGLLGILLTALPFINQYWPIKAEFSSLSPFWGVGVIMVAILLLWLRTQKTWIAISVASVLLFLNVEAAVFSVLGYRYDMAPAAEKIKQLQNDNIPVVFYIAKYHGQYNFVGRLIQPIPVIQTRASLKKWLEKYPNTVVLQVVSEDAEMHVLAAYPFKGRRVVFVPAEMFIQHLARH